MMKQQLILLILACSGVLAQQPCANLTTPDILGPFFVPNAPVLHEIAPADELAVKPNEVLLEGHIYDKNCREVDGAIVEVWHAGNGGNYTFPPDYLWYRGQDINIGGYNFRTVYPAVYEDRPIPHYHYLIVARGMEFVTQLYFPDDVPPSYEDYVRGRESQFPTSVEYLEGGTRRITWNVYLDIEV